MSFFVKCPKQRPVQGRFKKVQMYGAIGDKGMLLCTILKWPITVNIWGITKKDIHMLLLRTLGRVFDDERVKGLFTRTSNVYRGKIPVPILSPFLMISFRRLL
jgi:hypothetical protein